MSSILKALKKLEEQKADKGEGAVNIARDILRASRKAKKAENWVLPTAVVALLFTGGMIAYFVAGGFVTGGEESDPSPVVATAVEKEVGEPQVPAVVDRPQAVFSGTGTSSAEKDREVDSLVAAASSPQKESPDQVDARAAAAKAAGDEAAKTQKETAVALKDTARALKDTAEALKEKVVFPKEVVVMAQEKPAPAEAETVVALKEAPVGATPKPAAQKTERPAVTRTATPKGAQEAVETVRMTKKSAAPAVAARPEPREQNIYRPKAAAAADQPPPTTRAAEGELRVVAPTATSGNAQWSTTRKAPGTFPELRVSEIHYQWEVKNRLAVVNDLPVMEGTLIEGAKVDRILKDRVRFVFNGKYKEIRVRE